MILGGQVADNYLLIRLKAKMAIVSARHRNSLMQA